MKVYFVRHAQSVLNHEPRHQFPHTPLSEHGIKQAETVATRFKTIPLDLIITSTYTRASQTAREIEKMTGVPLIETDLLIERRMPAFFDGKLSDDPEIQEIHQSIRENFHKPDWHHSDEENLHDLFERMESLLAYILSQKKENIVVVTHGYFLMMCIYYLIFGRNWSPEAFKSFKDHTWYSNTGITLCEYNDDRWTVLTWNDYAHLG